MAGVIVKPRLQKPLTDFTNARPVSTGLLLKEPRVPNEVVEGVYRCSPPLIRPSKLTTKENGGVGKDLSEGWNLNFAVGCTHACPFCYVDSIHKRFGPSRYGEIVQGRWGNYFLTPENLDDAIARTPWGRWRGKEVMMSSTHDPYLPKLAEAARRILEQVLPAGVRICLQTRSYLVTKDLEFLAQYADQVRLQISLATLNRHFARKVEPRVPTPEARLEVLKKAKEAGLPTGVILAPIFPPVECRPDVIQDLKDLADALHNIRPDHVYGESLHVRGMNVQYVEEALGEPIRVTPGFDTGIARVFYEELEGRGLSGTWWYEH